LHPKPGQEGEEAHESVVDREEDKGLLKTPAFHRSSDEGRDGKSKHGRQHSCQMAFDQWGGITEKWLIRGLGGFHSKQPQASWGLSRGGIVKQTHIRTDQNSTSNEQRGSSR